MGALAILKLGVVATLAAARSIAPAAPDAVGEREVTTTTRHSNSIAAVVVDSDSGAIDVTPGPTKVVRTERWSVARPTVTETVRDGVLTITARCPRTAVSVNSCSTRFVINAPRSVRLTLSVSAGAVSTRGFQGNHDLRSSAGAVSALEVRAKTIKARSSAGRIVIESLTVPDVVEARTSSGDVRVTVPAGRYAVTTRTSSGDADVSGIQQDPKASRRIEARTSAGNVTVHGR